MSRALFLLFLGWHILAQAQYQTWYGVELGFKPVKKTKVELGLQHRMNGIKEWSRSYVQAKFHVKVVDGVQLFSGYRFGLLPNSNSDLDLNPTTYRHRTALGITINPTDWMLDKTRLSFGLTAQMQWNRAKFSRERTVFRSKVNAKYDIEHFPLSPFISGEYFYDFKRDISYTEDEVLIEGGTKAFRWFGGFEIELPKSHSFQLALGKRTAFLSNRSYWIASLTYHVRIQ
jgi:hypothetical protein